MTSVSLPILPGTIACTGLTAYTQARYINGGAMKAVGIKSYKQHRLQGAFDVIVIGSGISGMACAAILAKEGRRVLVLERHYTAGGFTHVFKRSDYEWDVGIHYIGSVSHPRSMLRVLFDYITNGELEWEDMGEVYDRVVFGDEVYEFHKRPRNFIAHLQERFPDSADKRAIEQYVELVGKASRAGLMYFNEKALPPDIAAAMGDAMRADFLRYASQTTREVLEELTDNIKLIGVLTAQYGDYGLPPGQSSFAMHAMVANHYMYGGAFPVGGSSRIAETIAPVIAASGGLILTNAAVAEILVENNRAVGVCMEDGTELHAPLVISSVGVENTYRYLLPAGVRDAFDLPAMADKVEPSVSHVDLYVGLQESSAELGLQKANYWVYPDDQYDHDATTAAYLADPNADFPLVFISFPSAKDPDWENRYPGTATVEVLTLAPYEWFRQWEDTKWKRRGDEYEAFKEQLSQRLLAVLYRYEPQLRGKVAHYELSTPLSTRKFANYRHGEIYGVAHTPDRFAQKFLRPHTPVANLYLTGQDIVTAGVGGALMAGVLTISAIEKEDYMTKIRNAVLRNT
ncbi:MAG: NAD(P)/FAD-dependent oxidoreductase [Anaerolineae bacterium]|nr:NAD(P)/FAD-dependent oxidoreductase [Anaerolineae bacterium]